MASTANASVSETTSEKGYLLNVTPIKISKNNNKYFNATLQTEFKDVQVVSFVADKHKTFLDAVQNKTPIKLKNFRYVQSRGNDSFDIQVSKASSIELMKSLAFKRKLDFDDHKNQEPELNAIGDIPTDTANIMYNIQGKFLGFTSDTEHIDIYGTLKEKRNALLGDETAKVIVALFDKKILEMQEDQSYILTHLSSRLYKGTFFLTTTSSTTITKTDDLTSISDSLLTSISKTIEGVIDQVQCSKKLKCKSCEKTLDEIDVEATVVKCPSCKLKTKVSSLKSIFVFRLNVQCNDGLKRLVSFKEPMEDFLKSMDRSELMDNMDQLENYLLDLTTVEITTANDQDVISSLKLK